MKKSRTKGRRTTTRTIKTRNFLIVLVLLPLVPGFNDWRGGESETQSVTRRGCLDDDWDEWLQMPGSGWLEEGIKREALLTA
jgi:hypothetical protein